MKQILSRLALVLFFTAIILSGCSRGARESNWTNLIISEGAIYTADLNQIRSMDAETGAPIWTFPAEESSEYGPFYNVSLEGGTLFVTSYERSRGGIFASAPEGVLRALSAEDGRPVWPEPITRQSNFVAPGAIADGLLVIGSGDGQVYAFSVEDGSEVWTFSTEGRVWATPLILSDTVYVAGLDHNFYALDLATGEEQWHLTVDGAMASRPLALEGRLYFGAFDHKLYAVQQEDGEEVWTTPFEGENWFWGTPATDGSLLYAADVNGNVYAIDAETGQEVWRSSVAEPVRLGPVLSPDGETLLVAGNNGTLYGLSTEDGFEVWAQPGEGQLASVAVDEDVVYVSRILTSEGRVQALYIDNRYPLWVYPEPEPEE